MIRFLYLHGFNSGPTSHKATQLRDWLAAHPGSGEITVPQLPHRPSAAIALAEAELLRMGPAGVTVVGSSLGGFYATWLAERYPIKAVLLNPAVLPQNNLDAYLGPQHNPYTGEDYALTTEHLDDMRALTVDSIRHPERYFVLLQTADEVLDWHHAAARFKAARVLVEVGGDHALSNFPAYLPAVVEFAGVKLPDLA